MLPRQEFDCSNQDHQLSFPAALAQAASRRNPQRATGRPRIDERCDILHQPDDLAQLHRPQTRPRSPDGAGLRATEQRRADRHMASATGHGRPDGHRPVHAGSQPDRRLRVLPRAEHPGAANSGAAVGTTLLAVVSKEKLTAGGTGGATLAS